MDIARAFQYIFEDDEWVNKFLMLLLVAFLSLITLPLLLLGLVGFAILLDVQVELLRNVREGMENPLPSLGPVGERVSSGIKVLGGILIYFIPAILLGMLLSGVFRRSDGSALALQCLQPLSIIYNVAVAPLIAIAMSRFADSSDLNEFFQFQNLFNVAFTEHRDTTIQFLIGAFVVSLGVGLLGLVPCLGTLAAIPANIAVLGHLYGQYAAQIEGKSNPGTT